MISNAIYQVNSIIKSSSRIVWFKITMFAVASSEIWASSLTVKVPQDISVFSLHINLHHFVLEISLLLSTENTPPAEKIRHNQFICFEAYQVWIEKLTEKLSHLLWTFPKADANSFSIISCEFQIFSSFSRSWFLTVDGCQRVECFIYG